MGRTMSTLALSIRTGLPRVRQLATIRSMAESVTDGELIARVGEGDPGAFELLYHRYARPRRRPAAGGRAEAGVGETCAPVGRPAGSSRRGGGRGARGLYAAARNAI